MNENDSDAPTNCCSRGAKTHAVSNDVGCKGVMERIRGERAWDTHVSSISLLTLLVFQ